MAVLAANSTELTLSVSPTFFFVSIFKKLIQNNNAVSVRCHTVLGGVSDALFSSCTCHSNSHQLPVDSGPLSSCVCQVHWPPSILAHFPLPRECTPSLSAPPLLPWMDGGPASTCLSYKLTGGKESMDIANEGYTILTSQALNGKVCCHVCGHE